MSSASTRMEAQVRRAAPQGSESEQNWHELPHGARIREMMEALVAINRRATPVRKGTWNRNKDRKLLNGAIACCLKPVPASFTWCK